MNLEGNLKPGQQISGSINSLSVLTISAYGIAVKNGFKGTEEEWLKSLEANPETIKGFVNEYLEENPTTVDTTLSNEGEAADAKATGDAIANAKTEAMNHIDDHANNKNNPHNVTAFQLGLYNVDNTSDMDKPVSTAQATAIADAKKAGTDAQTMANNAKTVAENAEKNAKDYAVEYTNEYANTVADLAEANAKDYADSLHNVIPVAVTASGWSESAPYTQTVVAEGILETDTPHWGVVYSGDNKVEQKEAFAVIDDLDTANGSVTFTCFEEKPVVNLTIQLEVNR